MFIKSLLIALLLPFLAHMLPMDPPNEGEITALVERCFYDVGVQTWMANPSHECQELKTPVNLTGLDKNSGYSPVFKAIRKIMIVQQNRRVIRQQREEMKLTMQCAFHMKIPPNYTAATYLPRECEMLWYGPSRIAHNNSEAHTQAHKQARRMAKYLAQLDWVPNSPEAVEDKKVALECFHAVQATCPPKSVCLVESCRGITWGNSTVNAKRTLLRKDYLLQLQVIRPAAMPPALYINATGSFVVKEMVALATVDYRMVAEYARENLDFVYCFSKKDFMMMDECHGISFKRPEKITTLREAYLVWIWSEIVQGAMYYPRYMPFVEGIFEIKREKEYSALVQRIEEELKEAQDEKRIDSELEIVRKLLERRLMRLSAEFMRHW